MEALRKNGTRILLIDDDVSVRASIRLVLEGAGFLVIEAANGREGLTYAEREEFDLVITDILMPELDGLETIRRLRQLISNVKIIAISGGGTVGPGVYLNLADKFGADAAIAKPLSKNELLQSVSTLLN